MHELATMAAQKHKEVEMRRKQMPGLESRASVTGIPGSPATMAAQQLAHRGQRSMSMSAATEVGNGKWLCF